MQVLDLDEQVKMLTSLIKKEKETSVTIKLNQKVRKNNSMTEKLRQDVQQIEDQRAVEETQQRLVMKELNDKIKLLEHEVKRSEVHLKEKGSEVKLSDLKIKELKKQVPGHKLKALPPSVYEVDIKKE